MADRIERFPLFPLGLVLLPSELLPLHIFEDRYQVMIGECLEDEREFGVVWLSEDGLSDIGCTARITEVLERMEDGRLNILVRGGRPFRLVRRIEELPYPAGDVELLDDDGEEMEATGADARERYADLVARVTDSRPEVGDLEDLGAYEMAATVELAPAPKQQLLELRSESARLEALGTLFAEAMKRLDYVERAGERARSNGRMASGPWQAPGRGS